MAGDQTKASDAGRKAPAAADLEDLPLDELQRYAWELGVQTEPDADKPAVIEAIRRREALLKRLDREAMLDVVIWARRPVRASASKEELARHIAKIQKADFRGLSYRGLVALAQLRGVKVQADDPAETIIAKLRKAEGLWQRFRRKRRALVASLIGSVIGVKTNENDYVFLPEESSQPPPVNLKSEIEERGVVGGLASTLRGVTDDYVRQKLDEIERRIDRKLDQIDRRLQEWRDREIANRLRIIKITLAASVIVAFLSLGYSYIKSRVAGGGTKTSGASVVTPAGGQGPDAAMPKSGPRSDPSDRNH